MSQNIANSVKESISLIAELWDRLSKPWKESGFTLYFFVVIIAFGGIGIWLSIYRGGDNVMANVSDNLFTYSIALLVPAFVNIVAPLVATYTHKLSWFLLILLTLFIEIVLVLWSENAKGLLIPSLMSTFIALGYWVIANSDNPGLRDKSFDQGIKGDINKHGNNWNQDE